MPFDKATNDVPPKMSTEAAPAAAGRADALTTATSAVIKVSEDGYLPAGIDQRARISSRIFTAEVGPDDVRRLQADPKVLSISTGRRIRPA